MRSTHLVTLLLLCVTIGASGSIAAVAEPLDRQLGRMRAEAKIAEQAARRLEEKAATERNEAMRLRASQAAMAEAIQSAEAQISAHELEIRLMMARLTAARRRLDEEQRPVSALLGGIATMAANPPLLAMVGRGGTDELVETQILLKETMPVIRSRSRTLSDQIAAMARLQQGLTQSRDQLSQQRASLAARQQSFAKLEERYATLASKTGAAAMTAGDEALIGRDMADQAGAALEMQRQARRTAGELMAVGPAPLPQGRQRRTGPLHYRLPADAPVNEGLGEVSESGIRSRGVTLATRRGQPVRVPASGVVRFAGPFRSSDGVVIIDHGGGWLTLLINVATTVKAGTRLEAGELLGRALGPIAVELSRNGQHWSPALIAGSSEVLSKQSNRG